MDIVWDERKRLANISKHGFDFADLADDFFSEALTGQGKSGRLVAVGRHHGGLVTIVFAELGTEALSIISMRPASIGERRRYEAEGI